MNDYFFGQNGPGTESQSDSTQPWMHQNRLVTVLCKPDLFVNMLYELSEDKAFTLVAVRTRVKDLLDVYKETLSDVSLQSM